MRKCLTILALTFLVSAPAFADDLSDLAQFLKQDLKAQKKELIKKGMVTFTDEEAKLFWPIYDAYSEELGKFIDARLALLKAYSDNYDNITDAKAQELLNRRFDQLKQRDKLDAKYRPKFATSLSPRRLVRFYQIEHELRTMIELQAIMQIPKMKWWQEKQ